jgi:hypothetical protein
METPWGSWVLVATVAIAATIGLAVATTTAEAEGTTLERGWMETGHRFTYTVASGGDVGTLTVTVDEVNQTHVNVHFSADGHTFERTFEKSSRQVTDGGLYAAQFWITGDNVDEEEAWLGHELGTLVGPPAGVYRFARPHDKHDFDRDRGVLHAIHTYRDTAVALTDETEDGLVPPVDDDGQGTVQASIGSEVTVEASPASIPDLRPFAPAETEDCQARAGFPGGLTETELCRAGTLGEGQTRTLTTTVEVERLTSGTSTTTYRDGDGDPVLRHVCETDGLVDVRDDVTCHVERLPTARNPGEWTAETEFAFDRCEDRDLRCQWSANPTWSH